MQSGLSCMSKKQMFRRLFFNWFFPLIGGPEGSSIDRGSEGAEDTYLLIIVYILGTFGPSIGLGKEQTNFQTVTSFN
jgi:hypothetical protein